MSPLTGTVRARLAAIRDRARTPRRDGPRAPTGELARLKRLTAERRYDEAVEAVELAAASYPTDEAWLRQSVSTLGKAGAITPQCDAARLLAELDPSVAEKAAQLDGRLRETSPEWRPEVPGTPERLAPVSPHKVLHLLKISLPYRQSGYSVRSKYTVQGQLAAGLEPVVLTALGFPRQIGVAEFPPEETVGGVRYLRLDGPSDAAELPADQYLQAYVEAAAPVVRAERPAVIHVHSGHRGFEAALVGLALGRHFGLPVVYEVRGFFESLWTADTAWSERSEIYRRRRDTENRCMAEAAAVVTLSESMREEIVARGIPAERVHVVPNGVDVDAFQPRERSAELAARLGLSGFTFGYVSNLDHFREGQELLVEAAVELRRRGIGATALIVGDGQRRAELERRAAELDAGDAVVFTGRVPHDEVLDYYALLDVFVIPRVDERAARLVTPLKPFEAMAAGIPLVTSDLPALREITGDGTRGRYFPAGDATGLADVLTDLQMAPDARAAMAQRARDWVAAERRWSANGKRYAELYAGL